MSASPLRAVQNSPDSVQGGHSVQAPQLALTVPTEVLDALAASVAAQLRDELAALAAASASPWLDVDGAAAYLVCRPHRIYGLVSEGRLRCAKDGRRSLFRREWLDAVLEETSS